MSNSFVKFFTEVTSSGFVKMDVRSKSKCPVFVASEMSGFKVVPSPIGLG
jgi:hypothetical protein